MRYKYNLAKCEINGQKFSFNGIEINITQEICRVTHSGSYDPIGYVTGDRTVDFELKGFKNDEEAALFHNAFKETNTFKIHVFDKKNDSNVEDLVGVLEGCRLKSFTEGMALRYSPERNEKSKII